MKYKIFKETRIRNNGVKEYRLYAKLWDNWLEFLIGFYNCGYLTPFAYTLCTHTWKRQVMYVTHCNCLNSIYWKIGEVNESEISEFRKNVETWIKDQKAMEISSSKIEVL